MYSILFLVRNLISRVPRNVRAQLERCRYLVQQMYWYVNAFELYSYINIIYINRGAELYAQNPNLIRKDENRVRIDEQDQELNRQSTLPSVMTTSNDLTFNPCVTPDL